MEAGPIRTPVNLHALVVRHPEATFFLRCAGSAMTDAGIYDGDILVVDKAVDAQDGNVVVATHAGEFWVRRYRVEGGQAWLYRDAIGEEDLAPVKDFEIWGVVNYSVHHPNGRKA